MITINDKKIKLNKWELSTIIRLLENSKKWDKLDIIDAYKKRGEEPSLSLIKILSTIEEDYENLLEKLFLLVKKMKKL